MGARDLARRGWGRIAYLLASRQARRHALSGPMRAWKIKRDYQIRFLKQNGLRPDHRLLEIGCGTLRGGVPIIEFLDEGRYVGVDVRERVLQEARREVVESGLEHKRPTLRLTDDLSRTELGRTFDVIWAFSVLMHLEDDVLSGALLFAGNHLAPDGRFFANVELGPERPDGTWAEFPNLVRPLERYRREAAAHGLTVRDMGPLSSLGHPPDAVNAHHHMLRFTVGERQGARDGGYPPPMGKRGKDGDERRTGADRRSGEDRRKQDEGPPEGAERRTGRDRRSGADRRSDDDGESRPQGA